MNEYVVVKHSGNEGERFELEGQNLGPIGRAIGGRLVRNLDAIPTCSLGHLRTKLGDFGIIDPVKDWNIFLEKLKEELKFHGNLWAFESDSSHSIGNGSKIWFALRHILTETYKVSDDMRNKINGEILGYHPLP